jgi:GxxExxY protein
MNTDGEVVGDSRGSRKESLHAELTGQIMKAAFEVSNTLGCGFLEKVYENALALELRATGLEVQQQVPIRVLYRNETVGEYCADMVVENAVLVETKATEKDSPVFVAQTLNYLKATRLPVALLLNFGQPRLSYRRLLLAHRLDQKDGMAEA